ncbi:MAG: response regulator transcription factor [Epulopiscium sp.]|nr:response regulator transcription factor [Candidatus Epulonipiscium sp.]
MEKNIKVIIADDHSMVREGLKQLIELEEDIEVIDQAGNGAEVIERVLEKTPDVVLMDINMPILNGIEATKKLRDKKIESKIIMLTIHNEIEYLFETVEMGIDGYVLKDSESEVLISAIRAVYKGESYIQPNMAAKLVKKMSKIQNDLGEKIENKEQLTRREIEVLQLVTEGMLNKEIAQKLCISEKTVKNHISNIFKKINVCDRTQAAVYAIREHIVNIYQI